MCWERLIAIFLGICSNKYFLCISTDACVLLFHQVTCLSRAINLSWCTFFSCFIKRFHTRNWLQGQCLIKSLTLFGFRKELLRFYFSMISNMICSTITDTKMTFHHWFQHDIKHDPPNWKKKDFSKSRSQADDFEVCYYDEFGIVCN